MAWPEVFIVFLVAHLFGDFALQTDWQARHKHGGLIPRRRESRRALVLHVTTYTLAFVPALVWLADGIGAGAAAGIAALIAVPHLVQDDGRLIDVWVGAVKGEAASQTGGVVVAVDQTFHAVTLLGIALLAGTL